MKKLLLRGRVITPLEDMDDGWVLVSEGRVSALGTGPPPEATREVGGPGDLVVPGFIDLQVNGYAGHDAAGGAEAISQIARHLPRTGVTAFLPTVITAPLASMLAACEAAREVQGQGARVLGAHLEGPFLNPVKKGAHDPSLMQPPTRPAAQRIVAARPRMVTLAPELEGAGAMIEELRGAGVLVSAGHSAASYEQARRAIEAGVGFATHLFNAMSAWGHREPALPGAVLTAPAVTAGLIADGIHVHPAVLELAIKLKGPGAVALTTDMVSAAGAPPGRYRLGSRQVISDGSRVCLTDGTLAGGAATMDGLVRLAAELPGVGVRHAVAMAALTPARALGETELGLIACGMPADLVLLDRELQVRMTLVGGEVLFQA